MTSDTPGYVTELAKELRKRQTDAEKILWEQLRKKKLDTMKFRRQYPIGRYIADFYCARANLVIEIDGKIHEKPEAMEYDTVRQEEIMSRGITVLRIKNEEVLERLDKVMEKIVLQLSSSKSGRNEKQVFEDDL